nr:immunoglobulin heavy chain junction region [Macaca mulatta]MOW48471.1 immunoglobulin heavy chain junction region [Macaca mulatta]MOW49996.1 immunoglobulin heavy chain junction region [Macaca mulatta]MOW50270.1 immunoglobulin heavy chain junction region [Macaca mulatta]MOW51341.1 immunoglobulin heavy chain junction region [Macaca mulatta]
CRIVVVVSATSPALNLDYW